MDEKLESLILRHFDGDLDTVEQRRLAAILETSPAARETLRRYLRLEGAVIKLALARQLGGGAAKPADPSRHDQARPVPVPPVGKSAERVTPLWSRATGLALAASVLMVLALGQWFFFSQRPSSTENQLATGSASGELGRLADVWLQIHQGSQAEDFAPIGQIPTAPQVSTAEDLSEFEPGADPTSPPTWMISAIAELQTDQTNPDEG